ncbi:MAG: general secretion pathway protein GspB [Candidatus Omnitrophica bacterium]|nr:general secretion pathway protein GspB [Candidatus Omnitrophota bacterium]
MKKVTYLLTLILLLSGCEQNQYQMIKNKEGTIYRLNKKTGEIAIINDKKVLPLKTLSQEEAESLLKNLNQKVAPSLPKTLSQKEAEFRLNLRLEGILWDSHNPIDSSVHIDGQAHKIGDTIGQYRIKEINRHSVIVERKGKLFEIKTE